MLTDNRIVDKLQEALDNYTPLRFRAVRGVRMRIHETREFLKAEPAGVRWKPAPPGTRWGRSGWTAWFQGDIRLPAACRGRPVFLHARTGGETLVWVNGQPQGIANYMEHGAVQFTPRGTTGRKYHIALEAYAGHTYAGIMPNHEPTVVAPRCRTFQGAELMLQREDVSAFVFDLQVLLGLTGILDENGLRRSQVMHGLAEVLATIDAKPDESPEDGWRPKLARARRIMRPLLAATNGTTAPRMGVVGHSHLDTAWLWPLAETRRKTARTFATALGLMERYPEFLFTQSSPCHTEMLREDYPGVFRRVRKMVAAGRWEPNGAMWVEPDLNVPSGEALVRQLLIGQEATQRWFGYRADTFWVPDVFGFSGALPQILRGAGVEFFSTHKMSWNDSTQFPYDTFHWTGIDGSSVLAHFCTIYPVPDPQTLHARWTAVQHKDVQDRMLHAFGYGDGGGGPTADMLELLRREQDLQGCPRTEYTTVSDFMKGIRDELKDLPEWVGELYLEAHRGTLTSIASLKRLNRQVEFALRDAEFAATLAALRGRRYPKRQLTALWKELLINQFHDILPGSSIPAVNDEAIASLSACRDGARQLASRGLGALARPAGRDAAGILLVNSLSWPRAGEIALDGAPAGTKPADPNVTGQWVRNVEGERKLVVAGVEIPALGGTVARLAKGRPTGRSAFKVTDRSIDGPMVRLRFDRAGRIVSLVHKPTGRETVLPGGSLNRLMLGQDVPHRFDNWEIDPDQQQNMRPVDTLLDRKVVANGPLQCRVRLTYRLGRRSRLTQHAVLHAGSAQVDFETLIDWNEKHLLLKAAFDLNVHAETARHEIQFGHIQRPTHGNLAEDRARFEVCAQKWSDLSDGGFGVALLDDCKYGLSVQGSTLALSLIKSGTHPDDRSDRGTHRVTYSLLPHDGAFSVESVVRPAYELNLSPMQVPVGARADNFGSLLEVDAPNIIVESVKWAQQGRAFVLRLYEAGGAACRTAIRFGPPVGTVQETNLLEEPHAKLSLRGQTLRLAFRPFEIKTLRCELD